MVFWRLLWIHLHAIPITLNCAREENPKDILERILLPVSGLKIQFFPSINKIKNSMDPKKVKNSLAGGWAVMFPSDHKQDP